jgi:hypothetical protein
MSIGLAECSVNKAGYESNQTSVGLLQGSDPNRIGPHDQAVEGIHPRHRRCWSGLIETVYGFSVLQGGVFVVPSADLTRVMAREYPRWTRLFVQQ